MYSIINKFEMNEFIMLNWYHFDLNKKIIQKLQERKKYVKLDRIAEINERMKKDFQLIIKPKKIKIA